ncbi:hypothetical protein ABZY58_12005 [Micromonospora tulbaghiae]|uniref:hypothetical protein n=1 Tax=Micromonospora tulbaghiae TaxID=479978 RepID=UPI0033B73B60
MTTRTTARRRPAAGPNPDKEQHVDYRTIERLLRAVQDGRIFLDFDHEYRDRRTNRTVSDGVYFAEDRQYLALTRDGGITVTEAGTAWLGLQRQANTQVMFTPPVVA